MPIQPKTYRPKAIDVTAVQHSGSAEDAKEIAAWAEGQAHVATNDPTELHVNTVKGIKKLREGQWIFKDARGKLEIFDAPDFEAAFEHVAFH